MDAINFLLDEHKKFRKALKAIGKIPDIHSRKVKFEAFAKDLAAHEKTEEAVWYPVLRKHPELAKIIKHLLSEEKSAAQAIRKFKKAQFDFMWKLRFYKFSHDVEHHANEEEHELFPKTRKIIPKTVLNKLGVKMKRFKKNLMDK